MQKLKDFLKEKIARCCKKYSKRAPSNIWNISSESHLEVTLTDKNSYSKRAITHKPRMYRVGIFFDYPAIWNSK